MAVKLITIKQRINLKQFNFKLTQPTQRPTLNLSESLNCETKAKIDLKLTHENGYKKRTFRWTFVFTFHSLHSIYFEIQNKNKKKMFFKVENFNF